MTDLIRPPPAQYLRDDAIRGGMDLLLFAHRSHLRRADDALESLGFGRAHHRLLYLVARRPGVSVGDALESLQVKKQSIGRVLSSLVERGYLEQRTCERDRRRRLLWLTIAGEKLELELFEELRANMVRAYSAAGEDAVHGFWILMQHLMTPDAREQFKSFHEAARPNERK